MPAFVDRTGRRYGRLTVIARAPNRPRANGRDARTMWTCRCDCGRQVSVDAASLASGNTKGCRPCAGLKDERGRRYGRLLVLDRASIPGTPSGAKWRCRCDCGKEVVTRGANLRRGESTSCGCIAVEKLRAAVTLPLGIAARNQILRATRRSARERGYELALTDQEIVGLMAKPCHYCGAVSSNLSTHPEFNGSFAYNGLDRVDNARGYTLDNIVPCCKWCNIAKRDRSAADFLNWVVALYAHSVVNAGKDN